MALEIYDTPKEKWGHELDAGDICIDHREPHVIWVCEDTFEPCGSTFLKIGRNLSTPHGFSLVYYHMRYQKEKVKVIAKATACRDLLNSVLLTEICKYDY